MAVRAKMRCTRTSSDFYQKQNDDKTFEPREMRTVHLQPIWEKDGPNRKWNDATPSGQLELVIDNPEAAKQFVGGALYYVDVSPAPDVD